MKEEERQPLPWEAVDPKPPIIRSGHLENRVRNEKEKNLSIVEKTF